VQRYGIRLILARLCERKIYIGSAFRFFPH